MFSAVAQITGSSSSLERPGSSALLPRCDSWVTLERLFRLKTIEYLLCSRAKNVCVGRVRAETLRRRAMLMYEFVGGVGGGVKTASEPCQMSLVAPAGSAGPEG